MRSPVLAAERHHFLNEGDREVMRRNLKRFDPIASLERAGSAVLEWPFIDFQGLDPGLEGRWWNSKLSRCSGRSGNPPLVSASAASIVSRSPLGSTFKAGD